MRENNNKQYLVYFYKCVALFLCFIKDLARSVVVHTLFDEIRNTVDETAATFEPIH